LPLLLAASDSQILLYDTTRLRAFAAVEQAYG
jgi:aspartate/glutamate racemase